MLCQSQEVARHHTTLRWKEWIPLLSQQLRLRNLVQIIAYNIHPDETCVHVMGEQSATQHCIGSHGRTVKSDSEQVKTSFYYTLHLTTMSAPFYTSEKLENENAKWTEIEISSFMNQINAAVNGVVVRLWSHHAGEQDHVITVWGVYFSGLVYLGPTPCANPSTLGVNTIVFHMQGGYFTAAQCIKDSPKKSRVTKVKLHSSDVKPSYNIDSLLRLHTKQQAIKKQMLAAQDLREKISAGSLTPKSYENVILRRLLNESRPKAPQRQELIKARQEVELAKFQVVMLHRERARKQGQLQSLFKTKESVIEANQDRGLELMNRYQSLHKDIEHLKDWRKTYIEMREAFLHTNAQLSFRRKQLISELNLIYPISQLDGKYSIGGIHLPNSEDFPGNEEVMISVALGFVAHLVQMVSIFLQVPLRYPIHHFSSRSKIIDHVAEKIPDKDREFPLFSRAKDKLQFNYGVYLLNKNIAQLRWLCGLPTQDLRATLPNITALLHLRPGSNGLDSSHHSLSGSSIDLRSSSQNISPVGSLQTSGLRRHPFGVVTRHSSGGTNHRHFERGHRISKSMGSSELKFPLKIADDEVQSAKEFPVGKVDNLPTTSSLSYSLDKGLDEYEEIKKAEGLSRPVSEQVVLSGPHSGLGTGLVGSEPILTPDMHEKLQLKNLPPKVNEAQKIFLQRWQAGGGLGQVCSDDDFEVLHRYTDGLEHSSQGPKTDTKQSVIKVINKSDLEIKPLEPVSQQFDQPAANSNQVPETSTIDVTSTDEFSIVQQKLSTSSLNLVPEMFKQDLMPSSIHSPDGSDECCIDEPCSSLVDVAIAEINKQWPLNLESDEHKNDFQNRHYHSECDGGVLSGDSESSIANSRSSLSQGNCREGGGLDSILGDISEDILFASVASRTEALANRTSSFNLVRSRHGSSLDDGPS